MKTETLLHMTKDAAGPLLLCVGLMTAVVAPAFCEAQSIVGHSTMVQAATAVWISTGNLNIARGGHTATLLPNGKVLVVGGANYDGNILDSAELYDPATGTWSATGRSNGSHAGHTATLLPNGQVLIVGGVNIVNSLDHAELSELYDSGTGTWTRTGAPATTRRFGYTATLLKTGKVLVAGGANQGFVGVVELYDPATGTWSRTGSLKTARALHQATLLQDGRVLVTGGTAAGDFSEDLSSAEIYDPIAGTWGSTSGSIHPRSLHTATLLANGMVLVAGGSSAFAEFFDPATSQWRLTGSLNADRIGHTATLLPDGTVLAVGGQTPFSPIVVTPDSAELYSPIVVTPDSAELYDQSTGKWEYTSTPIAARSGHTATLLPNGNVLIVGGTNGTLNSAELYGLVPSGTIGPGFTGSWYDPAQSGHGLFIEILPNSRFYAGWFTFNPGGAQAWFTGVGTYSGNTATITAVDQPTGGRWIPNFDPNQIVHNPWGTLTFTFTDCNHGRVDFNSVLGYGTGSMNLTRLTQVAGLTCP